MADYVELSRAGGQLVCRSSRGGWRRRGAAPMLELAAGECERLGLAEGETLYEV